MNRAVVLVSGGVDSATTLAIARAGGFETFALSFRYGQRHAIEIDAARNVARHLHASQHRVVDIDLRQFGGSALTDDALDVPRGRSRTAIADGGIPITYVPARNTIFLAFALAWAEVLGSSDVFLGVNAVDYSGYPDCRPEFLDAFERLANLATKAGVEGRQRLTIHAPLLRLAKADIIRWGDNLGVDFSLTRSCYAPTDDGVSCGTCDSCQLRLQGFAQAGLADPIPYADRLPSILR
jgi:7-cyano-7-deazaguanine synthase